MTRTEKENQRDGDFVPLPPDTFIPTDEELDAMCDEMMRFEPHGGLAEHKPTIAVGA